MTDFNNAARTWDRNSIHERRSEAIVNNLLKRVVVKPGLNALEFGAGTGIMSFMLADRFESIVMMDVASEMVAVMKEKVAESGCKNLRPIVFDLTENGYEPASFDVVFSQMALHHVADTDALLKHFFDLMKNGGFLAIADLYTEDGSFHGEGFDGHLGFDVDELERKVKQAGFARVQTETCFTMQKSTPTGLKDFPLFLMVAFK